MTFELIINTEFVAFDADFFAFLCHICSQLGVSCQFIPNLLLFIPLLSPSWRYFFLSLLSFLVHYFLSNSFFSVTLQNGSSLVPFHVRKWSDQRALFPHCVQHLDLFPSLVTPFLSSHGWSVCLVEVAKPYEIRIAINKIG